MKVKLLPPYGFCFGVDHVMKMVDKVVLKHPNEHIYCVGQLVHNKQAVDSIKEKGIDLKIGDKSKIIDEINEGVVIFSAHGTDKKILKKATDKGLVVYNAVCPFVNKEMDSIESLLLEGYEVIFIGVKNHDEANAILSLSEKIIFVTNEEDVSKIDLPRDSKNIVVVAQTTMLIDELQNIKNKLIKRFKYITFASEMCESTRTRQINLKKELENGLFDGIVIVGDENSNNGKSLYKIAKKYVSNTIMISVPEEIDLKWFEDKNCILIGSSASTSKENVEKIYKIIKNI